MVTNGQVGAVEVGQPRRLGGGLRAAASTTGAGTRGRPRAPAGSRRCPAAASLRRRARTADTRLGIAGHPTGSARPGQHRLSRRADPAAAVRGQGRAPPGPAAGPGRALLPRAAPQPRARCSTPWSRCVRGPARTGRPHGGLGPLGSTQAGEVDRNAALATAADAPGPTGSTPECSTTPSTSPRLDGASEAARHPLAGGHLARCSGCCGRSDRIPAYRLAGDVTLPGVGAVSTYWRRHLDRGRAARPPARGLVVDLRSSTYAAFWRPVARPGRRGSPPCACCTRSDGRRKVVSPLQQGHQGPDRPRPARGRRHPGTPVRGSPTSSRRWAGRSSSATAGPRRHPARRGRQRPLNASSIGRALNSRIEALPSAKNDSTVDRGGRQLHPVDRDSSGARRAAATSTLIGVTWVTRQHGAAGGTRASDRGRRLAAPAAATWLERLAAAGRVVHRPQPGVQVVGVARRGPPRRSALPGAELHLGQPVVEVDVVAEPSRRLISAVSAGATDRRADHRVDLLGQRRQPSAVARAWAPAVGVQAGSEPAEPPENRLPTVCAVTPCRTSTRVVGVPGRAPAAARAAGRPRSAARPRRARPPGPARPAVAGARWPRRAPR